MTATWYASVEATLAAVASAAGAFSGGGFRAWYAAWSSGALGSVPGTAAASAA